MLALLRPSTSFAGLGSKSVDYRAKPGHGGWCGSRARIRQSFRRLASVDRGSVTDACFDVLGRELIMLYELRVYECVPGRLPDLLKRFDTITLGLWEKHGIKQAGFWTTVIGELSQTLYTSWRGSCSRTARRSGPRSAPIRSGTRHAPRPRRTARSSPT